jgi:hypothetical protein
VTRAVGALGASEPPSGVSDRRSGRHLAYTGPAKVSSFDRPVKTLGSALVDADLASNPLGWQWTAACGADAVPYFPSFNPVLQGERFDPAGRSVRRWAPEISDRPVRYLHRPWQAPAALLKTASVMLGRSYPSPIVDLSSSRARAIEAVRRVVGSAAGTRGLTASLKRCF